MNTPPVGAEIRRRAAALQLMAFDVDGVLSDGRLYYTDSGEEIKAFNSRDGHGLKMLARAGVRIAIISGRNSRLVEARAANLGIDLVYQGIEDKAEAMVELLARLAIDPAAAGYMGDDIVDLSVMRYCTFGAAPANAHPLVRAAADWLSTLNGGEGAVRELCDFLIEARGAHDAVIGPYLLERRR